MPVAIRLGCGLMLAEYAFKRNNMIHMRLYLLVCAAVMTHGCTSVYTERVADIDPLGWRTDAPATVTIVNSDTVAEYDISLLVRVDNSFGAQMLPVTIRTITPDFARFEETLNLPLKPPATLKEDFYETVIPYRSGVVLNRAGQYIFEISTRTEGVRGIWGIGITMKTK